MIVFKFHPTFQFLNVRPVKMGTLANFHFDLKTEVTLNVSNAEAVTSLNVKSTEKG